MRQQTSPSKTFCQIFLFLFHSLISTPRHITFQLMENRKYTSTHLHTHTCQPKKKKIVMIAKTCDGKRWIMSSIKCGKSICIVSIGALVNCDILLGMKRITRCLSQNFSLCDIKEKMKIIEENCCKNDGI